MKNMWNDKQSLSFYRNMAIFIHLKNKFFSEFCKPFFSITFWQYFAKKKGGGLVAAVEALMKGQG